MKHSKKGFTLVELIVVATILTILATVGFISYEEYLTDTRDSKRLAQLAGLRDGLRIGITKGQLPLPDDNVEIRNNGTPFLYQGYAGENVLEGISYSEATKDPYDDTYYTYLLSRNRKDFQVMGFLEEYNPDVISSIFPESYATDYSQRFPQVMGKKLGILVQQETNTPLQEISEYTASGYIDLQDTTTNLFDAYVTDTQLISGKESDLIGIIPFTTCKKIKETGGSYGDGIYNINPSGLSPFEVYCNMEIDGGGWTLVARSHNSGAGAGFGWLDENGGVRDTSQVYSLGIETIDLGFSEIMLATYTTGMNIDYAVSVGVNKSFIKDDGNHESRDVTFGCNSLFPATSWTSPCDLISPAFGTWGWLVNSGVNRQMFTLRGNVGLSFQATGLTKSGYDTGGSDDIGIYDGEQGMIFVR